VAEIWDEFRIGRLFEASRDPIVLIEDTGKIVMWNRAATEIFGYTEAEAIGMNVDRLVPPEHAPAHHAGMERYRRTGRGKLVDQGHAIEVPAVRKDGTRVWIELALTSLEARGRHYALGILRDIGERVRLRERRVADQKQLEDAYRTLESFSSVVSHDLKEPVRGMGMYLQALQQDPDAPDRPELLSRAVAAHHDLERFVEGLLEWSRSAMTPVEPEPVSLPETLARPSVAAQWSSLLAKRAAKLQVDRNIPMVLATESLVARVFGNLITNAIRHDPGPSPSVRVRLGEERPPPEGPGFPPETLLAGADGPRTLRTGFGLAITRRAIERLEGEMELENRPEGGARVRIRLPTPLRVERTADPMQQRIKELV
jgi:PAS domain S-box-containing protein